jgi:hypothetical protein
MHVANDTSRFAITLILITGLAGCLQGGISQSGSAADSGGNTNGQGSGGDGASSGSGSTGNGGGTTGTAGMQVCVPNSQTACYSGPASTEGVGLCAGGMMTCLSDGSGFGPCEGQTVPTLENCASTADEDCNGLTDPCVGSAIWAAAYGGDSDQWGSSIATDPEGNVAVFGMFSGSIDFGGNPLPGSGTPDMFLTKLSSTGNTVWSKPFVSIGTPGYPSQVAFDNAGNIYITGSFMSSTDFGDGLIDPQGDSDVFLVKLDPMGNTLWSRSFGDTGTQIPHALAVTPIGVAIAGTFAGSVYFGGNVLASTDGSPDIFLAHFNADGDLLFDTRFGDGDLQDGRGLAVDDDGNFLLGATVHGSVDFGSNILTSSGQDDIAIAKFNLDGGHLWSKLIGNSSAQGVDNVAMDSSGHVIVTGMTSGTVDFGGGPLSPPGASGFYVLKLDPSGDYLWTRLYGNDYPAPPVFAAADGYDNVLLTGYFQSTLDLGGPILATSAGSHDVFALKLSPDGGHVWSNQYGDSTLPYASQAGCAVAADPSGNVLLTGYFAGAVDFGSGELLANDPSGTTDVFVAKLSP